MFWGMHASYMAIGISSISLVSIGSGVFLSLIIILWELPSLAKEKKPVQVSNLLTSAAGSRPNTSLTFGCLSCDSVPTLIIANNGCNFSNSIRVWVLEPLVDELKY